MHGPNVSQSNGHMSNFSKKWKYLGLLLQENCTLMLRLATGAEYFFKFLEAPRFLAGRNGEPGWWVWVASVYHILWELSRFLLPEGHTWVVPILKEQGWSFSQVWGLGLSSLSSNVLTYSLRLTACGAGQSGKKNKQTELRPISMPAFPISQG